jgi:hypothetical protein
VSSDEVTRRVAIVIQAFNLIHPDWRDYQEKMVWFGQRLTPNGDLNELQYMEVLYVLSKSRLASPEETPQRPQSGLPVIVKQPDPRQD